MITGKISVRKRRKNEADFAPRIFFVRRVFAENPGVISQMQTRFFAKLTCNRSLQTRKRLLQTGFFGLQTDKAGMQTGFFEKQTRKARLQTCKAALQTRKARMQTCN